MPKSPNLALQGFHALSEPLRLQILAQLQQEELCVCDLCDRLQMNQSKLSFHLKILKNAALIIPRQEGRWIYYRLNPEQFEALEDYLSQWSRLQNIKPAPICSETPLVLRTVTQEINNL
jgi:ArsR family transcriptional regulator